MMNADVVARGCHHCCRMGDSHRDSLMLYGLELNIKIPQPQSHSGRHLIQNPDFEHRPM